MHSGQAVNNNLYQKGVTGRHSKEVEEMAIKLFEGDVTMYRPTVRYDDVFKEYVDSLFQATHLDRNQIIRAALFAAAYSEEFHKLLEPHKKKDVPLPSPLWKPHHHAYWMEQNPRIGKEGEDVNVKHRGNAEVSEGTRNTIRRNSEPSEGFGTSPRSAGQIPTQRVIRSSGGITLKIN